LPPRPFITLAGSGAFPPGWHFIFHGRIVQEHIFPREPFIVNYYFRELSVYILRNKKIFIVPNWIGRSEAKNVTYGTEFTPRELEVTPYAGGPEILDFPYVVWRGGFKKIQPLP
jgi:hypothetical protein